MKTQFLCGDEEDKSSIYDKDSGIGIHSTLQTVSVRVLNSS